MNQCNFFVIRKKRKCRMHVKVGQEFCGEHQPVIIDENKNKDTNHYRIICPLDKKHTCYNYNLEKHLKICNARKPLPLPGYIKYGINSGKCNIEIEDDSYVPLSLISIQDLSLTIAKIDQVYEKMVKITQNYLTHNIIEEEIKKPKYGPRTLKHLIQSSSILGLMEEKHMLKSNTCYIEFGAGRGQLAFWLSKAIEMSTYLLIEKSSPKHKRDNKLNKDKVQRIRADISDLVLDELDAIKKCCSIVGVTKHLCGEATDLAFRCLTNMQNNQDKLIGFIMTFCCHHKCKWTSFVGKEFFEMNGFNKTDFYIMCGISSWATCGTGFSRERRNQTKPLINQRYIEIGLSREQKKEVGEKAKNIINWSRLQFLESLGFSCKLHYYVEPTITLENVCITATKTKNI